MVRFNLCVTLVALGFLVVVPAAEGVTITHNGVTIFADDFEGVTGVVGNAFDDADPVATIGTWELGENQYGNWDGSTQVQTSGDGEAYLPPAAHQGQNYLSLTRGEAPFGDGNNQTSAIATWGSTISTGVLRAEFMMHFPSVGPHGGPKKNGTVILGFTDSTDHLISGEEGIHYILDHTSTAIRARNSIPGGGNYHTVGSYTTDEWQRWVVETDFDSGDPGFPVTTVSIDGVVSTFTFIHQQGDAAQAFWLVGGEPDISFGLDAITEPPLLEADFDGDGDVDGDDFLRWQTGFPTASGASKMDGDANVDGDVDGDDFLIWQTEFPSPGSGAGSGVPEPASWALLVLLGLGAAVRRIKYG